MRTENWQGQEIRFVEVDGEWYAILKDICDALDLRTDKVASRLDSDMVKRVVVEVSNNPSKGVRSRGDNETRRMLVVNEIGIYESLFASRRPEARQMRRWTATVLQKLRTHVGLQGYEVMRMTETEVQADIDHLLDDIFWDDDKKMLMVSRTVDGGDVEIEPFEDQNLFED